MITEKIRHAFFGKKIKKPSTPPKQKLTDEQEHQNNVRCIKRDYTTGGFREYIAPSFGGGRYNNLPKYQSPFQINDLMKDFPEYSIINISESKGECGKTFTVWMKLKPEEERFLDNI